MRCEWRQLKRLNNDNGTFTILAMQGKGDYFLLHIKISQLLFLGLTDNVKGQYSSLVSSC